MAERSPFLTGAWRHLLLFNYEADPALLAPLVPAGTELDSWNGLTMVSLVGFLFAETRVLGIPVPGHQLFEEMNLRLYVRRVARDGALRRGVVFVREWVPRRAVVRMARWLYREPYVRAAMSHVRDLGTMTKDRPGFIRYSARYGRERLSMAATLSDPPRALLPGSEAEFITMRGWGYTSYPNRRTMEYRVIHPAWPVGDVAGGKFDGSGATWYGAELGRVVAGVPRSAFYAPDSAISVAWRRTLGSEDVEGDRHPT
ncbi:MAG: DUF2071 domain-containing protein [Gemmatimonadota bacterium]